MTWDFQQCGMCDQQGLRPACAYAQTDQSLCMSLNYSMSVKLLTELHLKFLSSEGSCTCSSESTLVSQNATLLEITCRGSNVCSIATSPVWPYWQSMSDLAGQVGCRNDNDRGDIHASRCWCPVWERVLQLPTIANTLEQPKSTGKHYRYWNHLNFYYWYWEKETILFDNCVWPVGFLLLRYSV